MSEFNPAEAIIGFGKQIAYCDTVNGTYIKVAGSQDITTPERELGKAETTNDDSEDFTKDYQPALYEPGTASFKYVYGATQYAALDAVFLLATVAATRPQATKFWKVTLPDGATKTFKGFLTKHSDPLEMEGTVIVECEIQVRSKVTYTPPASS